LQKDYLHVGDAGGARLLFRRYLLTGHHLHLNKEKFKSSS